MALYADPSNPLNAEPPDLHALIDRLMEGQIDTSDYPIESNPYQGVAQGVADRTGTSSSHGAAGQTPESLIGPDGYITGRAAEFATKKDLSNYARTGSLATGDNGIGAFGHVTSGETPFVAIPRDVLRSVYGNERLANGKQVEVISPNGKTAIIAIGDIGPRLANRANNAVIELNPAAKAVLGSGDSEGYRFRFVD